MALGPTRDTWIVTSGVDMHICNDSAQFYEWSNLLPPKMDEKTGDIFTGEGKIKLKVKQEDGTVCLLDLSEVWFNPSSTHNYVSMALLKHAGDCRRDTIRSEKERAEDDKMAELMRRIHHGYVLKTVGRDPSEIRYPCKLCDQRYQSRECRDAHEKGNHSLQSYLVWIMHSDQRWKRVVKGSDSPTSEEPSKPVQPLTEASPKPIGECQTFPAPMRPCSPSPIVEDPVHSTTEDCLHPNAGPSPSTSMNVMSLTYLMNMQRHDAAFNH